MSLVASWRKSSSDVIFWWYQLNQFHLACVLDDVSIDDTFSGWFNSFFFFGGGGGGGLSENFSGENLLSFILAPIAAAYTHTVGFDSE